MPAIRTLLVANRGEIALRILRTAREMGLRTVAVFSEADRHAPHVAFADAAVCIGPPPAAQSYLLIDNLLEAARQTGADAIHPGYGFLSERAEFSRRVEQAGLTFVGPSPESIEQMGSKIAAKQAARRMGVPLVPGLDAAVTDPAEARRVAADIGYPVLIKASAGGGGKGMRIVESEADFDEQMSRAVSEATASFGDGSVFIEKYITSPKHIEIQILGDKHGNVVHLFERECSIQRRHQKLVEEAPSPVVSPEMRNRMGRCAVDVARACGYYGAGTVEFIVDENLDFYFLEMNTRLQVEHPVTELITGTDLVREMIHVAEGRPLPFTQDDLSIRGHAIEVRVCAEDPRNQFLPDAGQLRTYRRPQGNGIRIDDGVEEGQHIAMEYDPMFAKLIVHAPTRRQAAEKMVRAIDEYQISGVQTTLPFCRFVMEHEAFLSGKFDTNFVSRYFRPELLDEAHKDPQLAPLAALLAVQWLSRKTAPAPPVPAASGRWKNRARS